MYVYVIIYSFHLSLASITVLITQLYSMDIIVAEGIIKANSTHVACSTGGHCVNPTFTLCSSLPLEKQTSVTIRSYSVKAEKDFHLWCKLGHLL